uniref:Small ribosomal subunit protein uS9c n=1 Tax=Eutreptia sp. CCAC 1914B TaxID=2979827 RepID=A0A977PJ98_9EUGL|nr:ribosomal protein S9 [Eutreptia sp. CCAC 1914B]
MLVQNYSIGRRKRANSLVELIEGNGKILINNVEGSKYFQYNPKLISNILLPLTTLEVQENFDIIVKIYGGGLSGQSEAIRLGVSKALCEIDISNRTKLKAKGLLTRNAKIKERKKYGLKKARKSPQFSKR